MPQFTSVAQVVAECKRLQTVGEPKSSTEEWIERAQQEGWVKYGPMDSYEVGLAIGNFVESRQQTIIWNAAKDLGMTYEALHTEVCENWGR